MVAVTNTLQLAADEANWAGLKEARVGPALARLVGDHPKVASVAVQCLVNLSADSDFQAQMLELRLVSSVMETLKDDSCPFRRHAVMLLANLCQTNAGSLQLLQKDDTKGTSVVGTHLRRLLSLFLVSPGKLAPAGPSSAAADSLASGSHGTEGDDFEYVAVVLQNVTQHEEARAILIDPERKIMDALIPQLRSRSVVRRRGVAAAIRNCCFASSRINTHGLLRPELHLLQSLVYPLVGPEPFKPGERDTMPPEWLAHGPAKRREADSSTRRSLVEALVLLTHSREARDLMRAMNVYPVLRNLHYWLEGETGLLAMLGKSPDEASLPATMDRSRVASRVESESDASARQAEGTEGFAPEAQRADESDLSPDDAFAVEAIHTLVQTLQADEDDGEAATATDPSHSKGITPYEVVMHESHSHSRVEELPEDSALAPSTVPEGGFEEVD
jgi:hypothetical protein